MDPGEKERSTVASAIRVVSVVTAYWFLSMAMVFLNKHLFSSENAALDVPLLITWIQCLISAILSWLCLLVSSVCCPQTSIHWLGISAEVRASCSTHNLRKVLPLSLCFVAMVTFNNLCIKYVTVSFYTFIRPLAMLFNIFFVYFILGEVTSLRAILCCAGIIAGFLLGVDQEDRQGTLSWIGLFYGIGSCMFAALNGVYTARVLSHVDKSAMKLTLCNNLNACLLFLPLIYLRGDMWIVLRAPFSENVAFWTSVAVSGVLGWSVAVVTGLQVLVTSPLTHNISGTAKSCFQTVLAVIWLTEMKRFLWWISSFIVLFGSLLYSIVRFHEMKEKSAHRKETRKTISEETAA